MRALAIIVLVAIAFLFQKPTSVAYDPAIVIINKNRGELVTNELATALMVWASNYTGLAMPKQMPLIVPLDWCDVQKTARRKCGQEEGDLTVMAVTKKDHVFLNKKWNVNDPYDLALLVHEFVHIMQFEADVSYACVAEWEKEAYAASFAFLASMKIEPFKAHGLDKMTLISITTCGL